LTEKSTLAVTDRESGAGTETPLQRDIQKKFTPESSREREIRVV
jgi:hypothetical protein